MKRHRSEGVALPERGRGRRSGFSVRRGGGFAADVSRAVPFSVFRCRLFVCPVFCFCRMVFFPAEKCFSRKDEFCVLRRMGEAPCLPDGGRQGKCARHTSVAGRGRKVENFVYRRVTVCFNGRTKSSCLRLSPGFVRPSCEDEAGSGPFCPSRSSFHIRTVGRSGRGFDRCRKSVGMPGRDDLRSKRFFVLRGFDFFAR